MSASFFPGCESTAVGVPTIQCFNAEANFALGWAIVVLVMLVLWRRVDFDPMKDRIAVISFAMSALSIFLISSGFLPEDAFTYFLVAAVGSIAALMFRR